MDAYPFSKRRYFQMGSDERIGYKRSSYICKYWFVDRLLFVLGSIRNVAGTMAVEHRVMDVSYEETLKFSQQTAKQVSAFFAINTASRCDRESEISTDDDKTYSPSP